MGALITVIFLMVLVLEWRRPLKHERTCYLMCVWAQFLHLFSLAPPSMTEWSAGLLSSFSASSAARSFVSCPDLDEKEKEKEEGKIVVIKKRRTSAQNFLSILSRLAIILKLKKRERGQTRVSGVNLRFQFRQCVCAESKDVYGLHPIQMKPKGEI